MFRLDDKFLEEVGLNNLPAEQKQAFLEQVYASLEERVGTRLSEGLTDAQFEEFEGIIDRDEAKVSAWLTEYAPDFRQDPAFVQLQQSSGASAEDATMQAEYAATKWLEVNRPNYRDVVAQVMQELRAEITQNRDAIIAATQQ